LYFALNLALPVGSHVNQIASLFQISNATKVKSGSPRIERDFDKIAPKVKFNVKSGETHTNARLTKFIKSN
jgi:hypothetical protein